jgi:phosphoribosylformylglycinamidine synthase subunit PurL
VTSPLVEPVADAAAARAQGMSAEEYATLRKLLGRTPTYTELGIASALWSEHCSYKSSRVHLRDLPSEGPRVLQGPGENAGVVDLGHGWVAVFKMESHNHPSFIEPYQGAATGVGGILRDIFTMGARPIALMDSLRFGSLDSPRMRHLVDGVVRGVGDYGNCVGVPTVGGETGFHSCYDGNILVNAFALGIARRDAIHKARAAGTGNPLLYVGSRTGRDGIHGATMASEAFDAASERKLPTVQVGDPFAEKVLLEATLQALKSGVVVAVQDMGAAGLTSSSFEMAGRGGTGLDLHLDKVPLREPGLVPWEIMLSESQERMLFVARRGREEELVRIFHRWGLEVADIGRITDSGRAVVRWHGETVAELPIDPLTDGAPAYRRPLQEPKDLAKRQRQPKAPVPNDPRGDLLALLGTPELGDKSWVFGQYDSTVRANTAAGPGGDAAVVLLKGSPLALAMTSDVNPVYCSLDPGAGAMQAVAEAVRNLACVGAEPVGITDCLNFGSPENPEVMWQFREAIRGISKACKAFAIPVISGNVSFYNDTEGRSIHPTPTIGMVGVIPDLERLPAAWFAQEGDRVILLGKDRGELGGSAYLRLRHGIEQGRPPEVDLAAEAALAALLRLLCFEGMASTVHDVSDGGLAVTLAEACFGRRLGAELVLPLTALQLFSETQARAVVAVPPAVSEEVLAIAEQGGVPAADVGRVGGDSLRLRFDGGQLVAAVADLHQAWSTALPRALDLDR